MLEIENFTLSKIFRSMKSLFSVWLNWPPPKHSKLKSFLSASDLEYALIKFKIFISRPSPHVKGYRALILIWFSLMYFQDSAPK